MALILMIYVRNIGENTPRSAQRNESIKVGRSQSQLRFLVSLLNETFSKISLILTKKNGCKYFGTTELRKIKREISAVEIFSKKNVK